MDNENYYNFLKNDSYNDEIDNEQDPKKRIVMKVDRFLESMGLWYSLFAKIILPFFLYIIPVNVILAWTNGFLQTRFLPEWKFEGTPMLVMWIVSMLIFLVLTILTPKLATAAEYILGLMYLIIAVHRFLFHGVLGYIVFIQTILFLLCKTVFWVFEIIRISNDKNNKENEEQTPYDDFLFTKSDDSTENVAVTADVLYFADDNQDEDFVHPGLADEQLVFSKDNEDNDENVTSDNDYIIG